MYRVICAAVGIALVASPVRAEGLKEQVAGAWTLTFGGEQMPNGSKTQPWKDGSLILDPSGQMSFFVFAADRKTAAGQPDPRNPVGPMVAYFGTWSADDAAKTVTYHIDQASTPAFNGVTRVQTVTVTTDTLVTKGSLVKTPQGEITPINEWRRTK